MSELSHVGMTSCFYCGDASEILLDTRVVNGQLRKSLPRECGVINMNPCAKCEGYMQAGIILIGYDEGKTDLDALEAKRLKWKRAHEANRGADQTPGSYGSRQYERDMRREGCDPWCFIPRDFYRTGQFAVVVDRFIAENPFPDAFKAMTLKQRFAFMPEGIMTDIIGESPTETDNEQTNS